MKNLLCLILLCVGCASAPPPAKTPVETTPCPSAPPAPPPCEDTVKIMGEEGTSCPANTRATFPMTGLFLPGKTVVLCQCK